MDVKRELGMDSPTAPNTTPPPPPLPPVSSYTPGKPLETQKPQEKPMTQQPGEVPANTPKSTANQMAEGAADKAAATKADGGFFSSSIKIGDMEIPVVLLLAVGAGLMFMGGKE